MTVQNAAAYGATQRADDPFQNGKIVSLKPNVDNTKKDADFFGSISNFVNECSTLNKHHEFCVKSLKEETTKLKSALNEQEVSDSNLSDLELNAKKIISTSLRCKDINEKYIQMVALCDKIENALPTVPDSSDSESLDSESSDSESSDSAYFLEYSNTASVVLTKEELLLLKPIMPPDLTNNLDEFERNVDCHYEGNTYFHFALTNEKVGKIYALEKKLKEEKKNLETKLVLLELKNNTLMSEGRTESPNNTLGPLMIYEEYIQKTEKDIAALRSDLQVKHPIAYLFAMAIVGISQ